MPFNLQLVSVMSVEADFDTYLPFKTCKYLASAKENATTKAAIINQINTKYPDAISNFTAAM